MNIAVRLDTGSIDRAIREVERIDQMMQQKCAELSKRLAEVGMDVVNTVYLGARYAGTNDISVHLEFGDNNCTIVANGSALGFIEFGTGVSWPLGDYAEQAGAPAHGTYGMGRGKQHKWIYRGDPGNFGEPDKKRPGLNWTSGNPPANAFPQATQAMREHVQQIAAEVFRFD